MITPSVFLIAPQSKEEVFKQYRRDNIVPQWHSQICIIKTLSAGKDSSSFRIEEASRVAKFFESHNATPEAQLLIHRECKFSHSKLKKIWVEHGYSQSNTSVSANKALKKRLKKASTRAGMYWVTYVEGQLNEFDGIKVSHARWLEQFNKLEIGHIGRQLLMQIRVIRFDNPSHPFRAKEHEVLGQNYRYCYICDDDAGGSWVGIKDQLTHEHKPENVECVKWNTDEEVLILPEHNIDELVLCEDGLWSGSETKKRLDALSKIEVKSRIKLKFAIVSDFGLQFARHVIRELSLEQQVQIDAHDAELVKFLDSSKPVDTSLSSDKYFKALHAQVEPAAFNNEDQWPDGKKEAIKICKELGVQLASHWLRGRYPDAEVNTRAKKFALGGGKFASTIFFKRSVPKVCLPLFWLDGEVKYNGITLNWTPLLVDPRRISEERLLFDDQ